MHIAHLHICTFAHLHISQINARLHISGQKEVCKILQDLQKVCKNLQDLQIFFAKFLANFEFFKNFSRSCCRFFSKIRQRDDRCSSSKIFKFTTENFLIFHIFEKKKCWSFSTSDYLSCEAPCSKQLFGIFFGFFKKCLEFFATEQSPLPNDGAERPRRHS